VCGVFDFVVPSAAPFVGWSLVFFCLAYATSINVRIGDRFSVWPWVDSPPSR
jgi:hypothetical protein